MPNVHYAKRKLLKKKNLNQNNLLLLAEASSAAVADENYDQTFSTTANPFDICGHPNARPLGNGNDVQSQTFPNLVEENPMQEMNTVIQNIIPPSSQPRSSFTWNIHSDKVLIDYCSYFLNSDGSIGDEKWAPLAHELGTSAASCRMRWHVLKGSASQATWEQQQQYLRQKLRHSVHEQDHQTSMYQTAQSTNDNPTRMMHSSSTTAQIREAEEYFNPEFDAYLQQVLWEDDDFVRKVDAIYRDEEEIKLLLESHSPMRVEI